MNLDISSPVYCLFDGDTLLVVYLLPCNAQGTVPWQGIFVLSMAPMTSL
jgi:hypothetical protein